MLERLDGVIRVFARVSPASIWRMLPFIAAISAFVLLLCSGHRLVVEPQPGRLKLAALIWFPLAALAFVFYLFPQHWLPDWLKQNNRSTAADYPWTTALLLTAAVAMVGLVAAGLLMLYPPNVANSELKAWSYLDKRWIVALYLLCVGLVYLPGIFKRLLEDPQSGRVPSLNGAAVQNQDAFHGPLRNVFIRALAAIIVGCALAVLYVVPLVPGTLERKLDSHELVHLGSLQRISQGARPYVDARTQYGPGHQFVTYKLMQSTEFTLRGFRLAHMLLNLVTVALLFSIVLFAFRWTVGAGIILVALFVSPLQLTSFSGYGLLMRWFAPFVVGAFAPLILWSRIRVGLQYALFAVLGATCGALAWLSQENGATSVITVLFVLGAAIICHGMSMRMALILAGLFVVGELASLISLLAWLVGMEHLGKALALYRGGSALVFAGMTNTPWSMMDTLWSAPRPGWGPAYNLIGWRPAFYLSGWRAAYYLTPYAIISLAALALYPLRHFGQLRGDFRAGQLLGMIAAAASLHMLTLFKSDSAHYVGASTALAALMVLSVVYLPQRVFQRFIPREGIRVALIVAFLAIYPFLSAKTEFKFRTAVQAETTYEGLKVIHQVSRGQKALHEPQSADLLVRRLGFRPDFEELCCNFNPLALTYGDWANVLREIRTATTGHSVYVDAKEKHSVLGSVASSVYFFADLRVGTAFAEPMMSIWVDDDVSAAKQDLRKNKPECIVSGDSGFLLTNFMLELYKDYSEYKIPGKVNAIVYCQKKT